MVAGSADTADLPADQKEGAARRPPLVQGHSGAIAGGQLAADTGSQWVVAPLVVAFGFPVALVVVVVVVVAGAVVVVVEPDIVHWPAGQTSEALEGEEATALLRELGAVVGAEIEPCCQKGPAEIADSQAVLVCFASSSVSGMNMDCLTVASVGWTRFVSTTR